MSQVQPVPILHLAPSVTQVQLAPTCIHNVLLNITSSTTFNLHSPSITQVQLAPTCIHNLLLNNTCSTSSNMHSPSATPPLQEDTGVEPWQDRAGEPPFL
jgi:hypothetical protein